MATSQKLTEHFLTCTICTEVFVNPCTLVCYHTFCRKCVINYTKTRPEADNAKSLICPFCSKMTKVSDPEKPVEEWADDVKPSFVMQGLLDSFGPESKDTTFCAFCKEGRETTPAVVWCSFCDDALCGKCVRVHSRIPATRHHDVTDLYGEAKVKRKRKVMCKEHKQECVEFLCEDCEKMVCHKCCIMYHRKCDSVVTIESQIENMKTELKKKRKTLSKKQVDTKLKIDELKSTVPKETSRYAQMEEDIMSVTQEAIQQIMFKRKQLLDNLKGMSDIHIGQLKASVKSRGFSLQMYQQQTELIDQALQSECDMDVYEMYQGCEEGGVEAVGDAEDGRMVRVTFRHDIEKLSKALGDLQLGAIDVLRDGDVDLTADPVLQDTITVRLAGEPRAARIADLTVMMVDGTDTVVVTDPVNESVKSFYTRNNQPCHSRLSLTNFPYGLTQLPHNQVAVTVPRKNKIVKLGVNPDLELLSTITTAKQYWDTTYVNPSTLAASSLVPPCVDILGMKGSVLKSFNPHDNGNIFRYPANLCTTNTGHILVSDRASKGVACLTPKGETVFHYRPTGDTALKEPRGITSTSRGDILVTDSSLNRVIHLTKSGEFVRNILTDEDGIQDPVGVDIDGRGRVYVGLYNLGIVKMYMC
ncbi:protein wech-like [Haliotis rubra]|uniref:protein wech-like n=1 Tax=Haliotis rubra TaxID=36100 RepID=UPI001EE5BCC1|nr:protein wech-like [Haliotis rubra]